ncbi:unnamed protein product [Adineta ricciae]|uniref:TIR domain-containing protein n=1 Tax=Adineta ricciae TaxID=249248 RepID=A0A816C5L7_ADIRI|nr:unnamed protein product [Adineta ricciae]
MSNFKIDEQCTLIKDYGSNISIEQLKMSFTVCHSVLEQINNVNMKNMFIDRIIRSLASVPYRNKKLADHELIQHELLILIRNNGIIDPLHRRETSDSQTENLLLDTSTLFVHLSSHIDDTNIAAFKHLFLQKVLIDELTHCLKDVAMHSHYLTTNSSLLRSVGFLLVIFKHFHDNPLNKKEYALILPIFFSVGQCLCSSRAVQTIRSLESNFVQKLDDEQALLLSTMPWYLQWYSGYRETKHLLKVHRTLLTEFTQWLINCHPDSYRHCSSKFATVLRHISYFLVRPIESDHINLFSNEFFHQYSQLVSYWSTVLASTLAYSSDELNTKFSASIIIQNIYNLSLHRNVLNFMKTIPNLIAMLLKLTDVNNDEIQLNAYRCLGKLMDETDIKTMTNPEQLVHVHVEFLVKSIDDPHKTERFSSLLESLKSKSDLVTIQREYLDVSSDFVQHDQVKIEFIKQNALSLLIQCVRDDRFDPIKVRQIALEILVALSFDNNACLVLKYNDQFIDQIRSLANNNQSSLQRAAEGLLWKLEKEEEAFTNTNKFNSYKYDIMISYSHRDQHICHRIHEQLTLDGFRVWFDRDCLRGSTMMGMADAIENSECVLICMSNSYKQSVYCQSEAHYAFERGCQLIPILVESNYKPDGWLGIIVSGKIYVDFVRTPFQSAYGRLKSEINEQSHRQQLEISNQFSESSHSVTHSIIDLPTCITQWTHEHVKSFFQQIKLEHSILHLCTYMDGHRLLHLYEMCLLNRESMYQSLKFELNERYRIFLSVTDYISFLDEIKFYVPFISKLVKPTPSTFLSITLCNIL